MKNIKSFYLIVFGVIAVNMMIGCGDDEKEKSKELFNGSSKYPVTQKILKAKDVISQLVSDTSFTIADGVTQTEIVYKNAEDLMMKIFVTEIDLKREELSLAVATCNDLPAFKNQTVRDMANYVDKPDNRVLAAINGDFYNVQTLVPRGILFKKGVAIKETFDPISGNPQQAVSFFAVNKDKSVNILPKESYANAKTNISEATGGGYILVEDTKLQHYKEFTAYDPRTAIGFTADKVIYFLVADGRLSIYSNGLKYLEMSRIMKSLGVEKAVNFDGGGSSTCVVRNPKTQVLEVRNKPSDGVERAVSNGWVVKQKK